MNAVREQKAAAPAAERGARAIKVPLEQPKPPLAVLNYQPAEVDAEYGCVDWYQYQVKVDDEETRH